MTVHPIDPEFVKYGNDPSSDFTLHKSIDQHVKYGWTMCSLLEVDPEFQGIGGRYVVLRLVPTYSEYMGLVAGFCFILCGGFISIYPEGTSLPEKLEGHSLLTLYLSLY
jgi:hypothetical protein